MMKNETHAYIVYGSADEAYRLASALVCEENSAEPCGVCPQCDKSSRGIHPDITAVKPPDDKRQIPVEQVRELVHSAHIAPNNAQSRVFLFSEAGETLSVISQNALLKLLEEPPKHMRIILHAEPGALLPTVRSRCRVVTFKAAEPETAPEILPWADAFFIALENGETALTRYSFELEKIPRADFPRLIAELRRRTAQFIRSGMMANKPKIPLKTLVSLSEILDEALVYLVYNVGSQHITAKICAQVSGVMFTQKILEEKN